MTPAVCGKGQAEDFNVFRIERAAMMANNMIFSTAEFQTLKDVPYCKDSCLQRYWMQSEGSRSAAMTKAVEPFTRYRNSCKPSCTMKSHCSILSDESLQRLEGLWVSKPWVVACHRSPTLLRMNEFATQRWEDNFRVRLASCHVRLVKFVLIAFVGSRAPCMKV